MDRLWTDGPPTRTYTPPQPPHPPFADEPPAAPPPPPRRGGGRWLAALGGGTVSAVVVAAVLLGTGLADDDTPSHVPATTPVSVSQPSGSNADIARRVYAAASNSVVSIRTGSGSGTGFLVDSDGIDRHQRARGRRLLRGRGPLRGLAATPTPPRCSASTRRPTSPRSRSTQVRPTASSRSRWPTPTRRSVGDPVVAIGYPLGLDRTATAGIVSGLNREIAAPNGFSIDKVIQTDAPINPGNSGGPLLNASGQVIGVNSQIATAGGGNGSVGIGFAVPANTVRDVLPQLEKGSAPQHAYLGVATGAAQNGAGAQVGNATAGGPARRGRYPAGGRHHRGRRRPGPEPRGRRPGDRGQQARRPRRGHGAAWRLRADDPRDARGAPGAAPEHRNAVSFQAPAFLLALLLVPLAALAYGVAQRRRRAAADAFATPAVRASALPRTPGWRRHAPVALYGLALSALAIALARPEATIALPAEQATIVLAIDRSGSMRATDVKPTRLEAMQAAANRFLDRVPRRVKVGAVAFNTKADVLEAPTTDRAPVRAAIEALTAGGGTATGDALNASLELIRRSGPDRPPAAVVLISDGESTAGRDPVRRRARRPTSACRCTRSHSGPRAPRSSTPRASDAARAARSRDAARDGRGIGRAVVRGRGRRRRLNPGATSGSARRWRPSANHKRSPQPSRAVRWRSWPAARFSPSTGSAASFK